MKITRIKKNGVVTPIEQLPHIRCGYCDRTIIIANEPKKKITLQEGLPICASCRIIKVSKFSDEIQHSNEFEKDKIIRDKVLQTKANDELIEVAFASQQETQTSIIK